ncbi:MAG: PAS domain S-box protein [Acidobacteria bacterium]|nr:PAS domain S-box protein [Acidobacteriota bacterium]
MKKDSRLNVNAAEGLLHDDGADRPAATPEAKPKTLLLIGEVAAWRHFMPQLRAANYQLHTLPHGQQALGVILEHSPDVILIDAELPNAAGLPLVQTLREEATSAALPILMLAANADHQFRIESLRCGADDILVQPFSAQELLDGLRSVQALAAIRQQAVERVNCILENLSDGLITLNRQWRYTYVNAEAEGLLGRRRAELLGKLVWEEAPHLAQSEMEPALRRAVSEQLVSDFESYDSTLQRWYENKIYPLPDGGVSVFFRDISERKSAEHANTLLAAIVESSADAIISKDLHGTIMSWNRGAQNLFGYTEAEAVGSAITLIIPPEQYEEERQIFKRLRRGEHLAHYETLRLTKDGRKVDVSLTLSPIRAGQGQIVGASSVARNITERKRIEATLQKQSERQRLMWEAASILLTTVEPDKMMREIFYKLAPHFELDTYFNFMVNEAGDALRLESCVGIAEEIAQSIQRLEFGQAVCGTVALCRTPIVATFIQDSDDQMTQLVKSFGIRAYTCSPLIADGKLLGTLSFASRTRDQFDDDEVEFLRTISHYVTVAYERLGLVRELKENDRRKDEFLATLAHELRNPLAPIRNGLQIMRLAPDNREAVEQAHSMMERQLQQMVRLIDDLLDLSRISQGKIELRKERVNLAEVAQIAIEISRPLFQRYGHQLTLELPDQAIPVEADVTRLAQVFANLLNNAAKYTEKDGQIYFRARQQGDEIVISIKDNGIGIPVFMLTKVFEMFTQAHPLPERTKDGLGIGLSIARRLVEMHGGNITAHSAGYGTGSEFVIRLPALGSAKPSSLVPEEQAQAPTAAARRRILVADDNVDSADSMAILLGIMGNEVRTANDGLAAVKETMGFRPDVILLDIGMPEMNGYDACRRIRELPEGKEVVIIALTGWGQDEDRRQSQEAGFTHHLVKPVDLGALEKLLDKLGDEAV